MSGSQIGSVVGGVIGFYVSGGTWQGAQWGMAIGGLVGGAVKPDVVRGPSIGDAQAQTSQAGVPIPKIFGHPAPIAGTLIDGDPIARKVVRETQEGKGGGPIVKTEGWIATRVFLVCEGEIAGYGRIYRNGKLVYSSIPGDQIDADSGGFASQLRLYTGTEAQLPDPVLEAIHGVNNTNAYPGRAYVIVIDDDETQSGGAANQYRFEPIAAGTVETEWASPAFGVQTHDLVITGNDNTAYTNYDSRGCRHWITAGDELSVGEDVDSARFNSTLTGKSGITVTNVGDSPSTTHELLMRGHFVGGTFVKYTWSISADDDGRCLLLRGGRFVSELRPIGYGAGWWYSESLHYPEYGGLVWFSGTSVYVGVRRVGFSGEVHNKIYRWPLIDADGEVVEAQAASDVITTGDYFYLHMDVGGLLRAIALDEAELVTYDPGLTEASRVALPMSLTGLVGFAVDRGFLFLLINPAPATQDATLQVYDLATWMPISFITVERPLIGYNHRIIFSDNSIFVQSGKNLKRIQYTPYCFTSAPPGWSEIPDALGWLMNDDGVKMPLCSASKNVIAADAAIWKDVATEIATRCTLPSSKLDIDNMTDEVPGFILARADLSGADYLRSLAGPYFVNLPEYDGQIHAIRLGGAVVETIDEDDVLEVEEEDDDDREMQNALPSRVSLLYPDPANNYVMTPQTAPRTSPDITAVNELQMQTVIPFSADQAMQIADITQKIIFARAEGGFRRALPAEYSGLVPSDPIMFRGRRNIVERKQDDDAMVTIEAVYDRVSAYTSNMTGAVANAPQPQSSNTKGLTVFTAVNLPQLRSQDSVAGAYVGAHGVLPAWPGALLQMSVDGGLTWVQVLTMTNAATMGWLLGQSTDSGGDVFTVELSNGDLETVTPAQVSAGLNAFAIENVDSVCEVAQFQTATEIEPDIYDLSDLTRGLKGTQSPEYTGGEGFLLLNERIYFLPLDLSLAGKTILFRPVTIGTLADNNPTYEFTFIPVYTTPEIVEFLITEAGEIVMTETGDFLLVS